MGRLNLVPGNEKNTDQTKNKNRVTRDGSPRKEVKVETTGVGFVKQVGFKPEVKERGSNG